MKRRIISIFLLLAICLSLSITVFAGETLVYDEADLLTDREEARIQELLETVSRKNSAQIIVVTIPSAEGADVDYIPDSIYDGMSFGYGENRDGVLLMVCMDPREYRILSNGYPGYAISGSEIDAIGDAIVSDLSDGWYADAFETFAARCDYYLDGYVNGFPFNFGESLLIALVVGIVVGLIVALVLKGQLRSVHRQNQANLYVKQGSLQLTAHHDIFMYRNVTRRKRESSSGSRSGGSRSRGGGSF